MPTLKSIGVFSRQYNIATLIAAIVASIAATTSAYLSVPPWVMFIGWVAYFTHPGTLSNTFLSMLCVCLGILTGIIAAIGIGTLLPDIGAAAFAVVVFFVGIFVISLRGVPWVSNSAAWFLGLIMYFAAHVEPSIESLFPLFSMVIFGTISGYIAHQMQLKVLLKQRK